MTAHICRVKICIVQVPGLSSVCDVRYLIKGVNAISMSSSQDRMKCDFIGKRVVLLKKHTKPTIGRLLEI